MDERINGFFAYAPWIGFAIVVLSVYFVSRGQRHAIQPIGQTFACNECGHRAKREHMIPIARQGMVLWYCPRHGSE